MPAYYFMNIAGCRLSEEQMETINYPRVELVTHVTTKTVQTGSLVGALMVGPIVSAARGHRDMKSIEESSYHYAKKGALVGLVMGPVLLASAAMMGNSTDLARDRAYRVRYNRNQNFVDRLSFAGAALGAGAAHFLGQELGRGVIYGFAGGCILGGVINNMF